MRSTKARALVTVALMASTAFGAGCSDDSPSPVETISSSEAAPTNQDAGHQKLNQLVGEWNGAKSTFIAGGTADNPIKSDITSRWHWIGKTGNNFMQEEAEGTFGGKPYYRLGTLGYSPTDDRYEWSTVDSVTPMMMTYKGAKASGSAADIGVAGEFTDPGVLGPQFVGKTIPMRTVIELESADRVTMELYFAPPGEAERIADRVILTRK
ncbi:DUF1579 family protein [Nocardia pseudovaccinii]|uniref:DUF1579 family protein n=1 Tax=Nocardia pseudovaccinii TaxID=189540 RepID=UPI000A6D272C|nr:DUF1579 family protein [Nocardia pseudovaccinii]